METLTLASIDIGSNAARLLIRRIEADGRTRPASAKLLFLRYPLRLGDDVFVAGSISPARVKKMCRMIKAFRQLMRLYGVASYRACATSAMREAANGREVARLIKRRTGVRIEIISGSTEASIIIVPAAEIFLMIAEVLGAKRIAVPMLGLADGIIDDMYARHCAAARLGAGRRK